jgi:HK97 family phage major capsid protein
MNIKALKQRKADLVAQMKAVQGKLGATDLTVADEDDKKAQAPGLFGRQLQAVRNIALREASAEDIKLAKMMAGPTGMSTDVPSDGGFLVGQERSSTIMQRAYATGEILSLIQPLPIGPNSNGMVLPAIDERAVRTARGSAASSPAGSARATRSAPASRSSVR